MGKHCLQTAYTFELSSLNIFIILYWHSYPSTFIANEFRKFFFEYISTCPFLPFIDDEQQYFHMRHKLLGKPTRRQSQVALSAAAADTDNDQTDDRIMEQQSTTTTDKKSTNYGEKFFVHYTHEQRFNTLKKEMHQVYDDVFRNTPAMYTKMRVCTRNRRDAKNELIRKRPKRTLLRNTRKERTHHSYNRP